MANISSNYLIIYTKEIQDAQFTGDKTPYFLYIGNAN